MMTIALLEDLKDLASMIQDIVEAEPDMSCRQVYHTAEDAIRFLPQNPTDILVVDIGLPRASGIEAMQTLGLLCPAMQFCMFTVYEDDEKIFRSLQAGARGYILKGSTPAHLVSSLRELYHGGSPMSASIARRLLELIRRMPPIQTTVALPITPRERELLEWLSQGLLYKEISDKMGITTGTVKQHIHKIYQKLHVTNRTEATNRLKG
jgi:DNA-binding NarL/FixJ family response regulator